MKDFEAGMERMKRAVVELGYAAHEAGLGVGCLSAGEVERMKNCVNCDHSEVCVVVARRRAQHANNYTPCSKWKLVEERCETEELPF